MKALTLTQPWASLVAWGEKKIETRSWHAAYRGELAIHAAVRMPRDAQEQCWQTDFAVVLERHGAIVRRGETGVALPRGQIIAICELQDCIRTEDLWPISTQERAFGDYSAGRHAFVLRNVRLVAPISVTGHLGLWDWM